MSHVQAISEFIRVLEGTANEPMTRSFTKEGVLNFLKELTDEDFGYDGQAWRNYFRQYDLWSFEEAEVALKGRFRRQREERAKENSDNKENLT